ncbi:MAG: S41 family peptidase [Candidatus Gracilibacteria bacterium]
MNRITFKFLAVILGLLISLNSAFAFFSDVPTSHPYYQEIKELSENGLLLETSTNEFHPNDPLTNADFYRLMLEYAKAPLAQKANLPFKDTSNAANYAPYLQTALNLGILNAQGSNPMFYPKKQITKSTALKALFQALGIGTSPFFDQSKFPFSDLDPASELAQVAQKAAELNILEPAPNSKLFKRDKRVTRGDLADYLYKIYQYKPTSVANVQIKYIVKEAPDNSAAITKTESFDTMQNVWDVLHQEYYYKDKLDDQDLVFGAIKGMVNETGDAYTVFETPEEAAGFLGNLSDEFEGVGMQIELIDGNITVIAPLKDSPAEKAGIKASDIILEVNDENVVGQSIQYVTDKIKGKAGTKVTIKVKRGAREFKITITRAKIKNESISFEMIEKKNHKIAYIDYRIFSADSYNAFVTAAKDLIAKKPDSFIIDLRNNPGGYMDTAVKIVGLFTTRVRTALQLEYADGSRENYKTDGNGLLNNYKVILLVNGGSASSSEIVASALQELRRATLIGETTFGKGSVQQILTYRDGSLLKYTVSKWLTPSGKWINGQGIKPDIFVKNADGKDQQLDRAILELTKD